MRLPTAAGAVLFSLAVGLAACNSGAAPRATTDRVELDEFSIDAAAASWAAGPLQLTVANIGERAHTLVISRDDGQVVAATDVLESSQAADFAVELEPGTYQLTCRIVVEGGKGQLFDHFEQGMHTTVEVEG